MTLSRRHSETRLLDGQMKNLKTTNNEVVNNSIKKDALESASLKILMFSVV